MHTKILTLLLVTGSLFFSVKSFTFAADVHTWEGGSSHVESFGGPIYRPETGGYYDDVWADDSEESDNVSGSAYRRYSGAEINPATGKNYPPPASYGATNPTTGTITPPPHSGGVIDTSTGTFFHPAAGGVIDPRTGTFYISTPGGVINSQTGAFHPTSP